MDQILIKLKMVTVFRIQFCSINDINFVSIFRNFEFKLIVRQNIQHHLTTLTSNCDKYISTNPITINNSLTIQTKLKSNKTLYRNAQTTNATPEASKIRKGMFFSRHSRNNSQNYQPIVINSQFQRNLIYRSVNQNQGSVSYRTEANQQMGLIQFEQLQVMSLQQIGLLKDQNGHSLNMSQEDFQKMEQIMIQDHSQFMQSQINTNTQQYYPLPQTQFPIPLKHQYQQNCHFNQQQSHVGNQTQMYESQLPNINEQMNFLTQDIQNAKNISTILKEYHEGLKSHQKSKSISVNSQSTPFNKNSFQNNNTKVVLTKLIGGSDPDSQILIQQDSLRAGKEQIMSYNQANNTMNYKIKINKLYEEQNNQKIKSIKEILNRNMGHRVKMSNDSSIMGTSVIRQRYLRPKLPTILAKTMQLENNQNLRLIQNSQNTSQTIDKFDEVRNLKLGREQIEAKVFMNKELKKALQQKQNRYRENILSMTIKNYRNDSKNILENQLNKDLQDSNILDNHNVSHQSSIQNLTKANIKAIDQFTSSPSQLMKHKKSISQNFTTKNLSSALSRKSSYNLKKVERESQTVSFIENQKDKQVQFNIDILKSQVSSKLQLQQANSIQSQNQVKSQNQKDQILKQKQNNINRVRVLQKTGKNTYNPNLERLILNKKLFERDSSQLKRWGQAQNNQGTEGGQLSAFINTDINLVTSSMDTSIQNSPDKLKARQSHLNQYLVQNSNLQSR